jgi:hypothetical protein
MCRLSSAAISIVDFMLPHLSIMENQRRGRDCHSPVSCCFQRELRGPQTAILRGLGSLIQEPGLAVGDCFKC